MSGELPPGGTLQESLFCSIVALAFRDLSPESTGATARVERMGCERRCRVSNLRPGRLQLPPAEGWLPYTRDALFVLRCGK